MSKSDRSGQTCRRSRQYYGGPPRVSQLGLIARVRLSSAILLIGLLLGPTVVEGQNLLHIRVLEGEGIIRPAGSKDARGLAVQITDETGKPVEAATVSFRLPEEGPGGVFARGLKTEIITTAADGRAPVYGITWNQQPGPFQIRVTALKGQVRAGTVISEYISSAPASKAGRSAGARSGMTGKKWLIVAAIAGGGAAAAVLALGGKGSSAGSAPVGPAPQIGTPTITIGSGN